MSSPERKGALPEIPELWSSAPDPATSLDLRRAMTIAGGLLLLLAALAIAVPIGGAVLGSGQVGVESRVKRIAHPFGGVIAEILVANGEHVEKDQLLIRLDDRVTGAGAALSSLTVEQLLAQKARLEAERMGAARIAFPAELVSSATAGAQGAMADETRLFAIRSSEQGQIRAQLAARIAQLGEQIVSVRAQIASLERQRELIGPELQGLRELFQKGLVTISRLNQLERTAAEIDAGIASLQAQIAQTRSQISETRERAIQLAETRRAEAGAELSRVLIALNEQRVKSIAADDQQNRSEIRAPYAGTIEKIAFSAIGDVIRPAEPIMEIVPDADAMVVEVMVGPADIDQVRKGQNASIRFTAFNLSATPDIPGKVTYVATDRSDNPETRESYYMVRVAIDQARLAGEGLALRSGMPAEVHIATGDRSLLSYVTKPLRDQFARAFRDN